MVECFSSSYPAGVMLRAPWLLLNLLGILVLVISLTQAIPENKLSDVSGEEGVIDQLEAYLLSQGINQDQLQQQQEEQLQQQQHLLQPQVQAQFIKKDQESEDILLQPPSASSSSSSAASHPGSAREHSSFSSSSSSSSSHHAAPSPGDRAAVEEAPSTNSAAPGEQLPQEKGRKIEFGVGPSDPRYFDQDEDPGKPRARNINTRSGATFQPYNPNAYYNFNPGYNGPDAAAADVGGGGVGGIYLPDDRLELARQEYLNSGVNPDTYLGDLVGAGGVGRDPSDDVDQLQYKPLYNLLSNRLSNRYGGEDQGEFMRQLEEVLQRGDGDTARLMLGPTANLLNDELRESRRPATSQPESVHFLHHKPLRELPPPTTSHHPQQQQQQQVSPALAQASEDLTDDNPNDPASHTNIDSSLANKTATAVGGQLLAAGPGHLSKSQLSTGMAKASMVQHANQDSFSDVYFTAMVAGCTAAAVCAIIATGVCWYRLNKNQRAAKDAEYPAYGVTGPSRDLSPGSGGGDRTLAHSAHMYHYQQQKNQMIAIDKSGVGEAGGAGGGGASDVDSEEEEGEDRDYTVYECPGLAPMGEMVVPNPMYPTEDATPASPSLKEELDRAKEAN